MADSRARRVNRTPLLLVGAGLASMLVAVYATATGYPPSGNDALRRGPGDINHPVQVVPSDAVQVPRDWPLDQRGAITCLTCHSQLPSLQGNGRRFLRDFDEATYDTSAFCAKCHRSDGPRSSSTFHWMAVRSAHVRNSGATASEPAGRLDATSRRCLSCHDGVNASETRSAFAGTHQPGYVGDPRRNHPVGVEYPTKVQRSRGVPFRPVSMLPREVSLPGGQVSCISCHNLYADRPGLLAVPIEGSKLCMTCHQME
jgi:hypothetical protein